MSGKVYWPSIYLIDESGIIGDRDLQRNLKHLILLVAGLAACRAQDPTGEPAADAVFSALRAQASALQVNDTGHWEARFPGGHVLVHVPAGEFVRGSEEAPRDE